MLCDSNDLWWMISHPRFFHVSQAQQNRLYFIWQLVDLDFSDEEIYLVGILVSVWINNWYCFQCYSTFALHRSEWNSPFYLLLLRLLLYLFSIQNQSPCMRHRLHGWCTSAGNLTNFLIAWKSDRTRAQINEYK